jgi:hypothetical protein
MCDAVSCTNTMFDRNNCGMCGMVCPAATPACVMGACTNAPPTHYTVAAASATEVPFIDACAAAGHTVVLPNADDSYTSVPLPFPFRYWATDLAAGSPINVSSNGFMNMDGVMTYVYYSMSIPDPAGPAPNSVIAPHWGDDHTSGMGMCIATIGSAPNRQWVIEWAHGYYCCSPGPDLTYEVILNENSGMIDMVFQTMTGGRAQLTGLEDPTGMMGISGCVGTTPASYSCLPAAGTRVRFTPTP